MTIYKEGPTCLFYAFLIAFEEIELQCSKLGCNGFSNVRKFRRNPYADVLVSHANSSTLEYSGNSSADRVLTIRSRGHTSGCLQALTKYEGVCDRDSEQTLVLV